jgi:HD-GYP domain-containing protein (c-di-GMP phosphodiesterase class II)
MLHEAILHRETATLSLSELLGAFSYALDLTEGQPAGHCARACLIGSRIGEFLGLDARERHDLYYTLLLKDLGCSSNAARIWELYKTDERRFKRDFKTIPTGLKATLGFVFTQSAREFSLGTRAAVIGNILRNGDEIAQEMIRTRCTRGSEIARKLRFSPAVCDGIYRLDEHWDGSGRPGKLSGEAIPLYARIALLAQVADVFHSHGGRAAAVEEVRARSGTWFDPRLVRVFEFLARKDDFWEPLASPAIDLLVQKYAPREHVVPIDDEYLDDITAAFGEVIDAKSPYTAGHSDRVAIYTDKVAESMGVLPTRRRRLRRAAALHDIGKLGVPNSILDKPGRLDDREWISMRDHAVQTNEILGRVGALADLAPLAASHHERLDGAGYPLGLDDRSISRETRIITVCDFYDALTADRPYRAAMTQDKAFSIMQGEVGAAIDGNCFEALRAAVTA